MTGFLLLIILGILVASMKVRPFYGWVIVAVAFLSMAFWMGIRASFSVFYSYLVEEFSWGRGEAAIAQSIGFVMYMVSVPFIGGLIDRFGPRKVVIPGILLCAMGLSLCSFTDDLWSFYLFYGVLVGTGVSFFSIVTYSSILAHWFERKRGLASGIASSGMGVGTFLLVLLAERFIRAWGWRWAFTILAAITLLVLLPSNGLLLRHKPQELGLGPDGVPCRGENEGEGGEGFLMALKTRRFWLFVAFASLALLSIQIILVHNVRFLVDKGVERGSAALAFAFVGIVSSVFRIFWGWLSDRIGRETSYSFGAVCVALSALCLLGVSPDRGLFLYLFVIFFGMGWGATAPSFMAVAADLFKGSHFGAIYGFFESSMYILSAIGVWAAGYVFDITGSYLPAFLMAMVSILLSIALLWVTAPRKYRPRPLTDA